MLSPPRIPRRSHSGVYNTVNYFSVWKVSGGHRSFARARPPQLLIHIIVQSRHPFPLNTASCLHTASRTSEMARLDARVASKPSCRLYTQNTIPWPDVFQAPPAMAEFSPGSSSAGGGKPTSSNKCFVYSRVMTKGSRMMWGHGNPRRVYIVGNRRRVRRSTGLSGCRPALPQVPPGSNPGISPPRSASGVAGYPDRKGARALHIRCQPPG